MRTAIVSLLPLVVGAAVLPLWVFVSMLLLRGERGVVRALAFSAGAVAVRVAQLALFGFVFRATGDVRTESVIASTLQMVVGIFLLITAATTWLWVTDPDASPPGWMAKVGGMSAPAAFGAGALLMATAIKQWIFTLSAIAVIDEVGLSPGPRVFVNLLFVVAAQSLVLAPAVVCALAPARSAALLDAAQRWLERNQRAMTISVSLVFGVWFLRKGVVGLMGSGRPAGAGVGAAARL